MEKTNLRYPTVTIKSYMIFFLAALAAGTMIALSNYNFLVQIIVVPVFAAALDMAINYVKNRNVIVPDSALISGLFVALLLPQLHLLVLSAVAAVAIISKHVIKFHNRNIFNPAAFGIVVGSVIFSFSTSWWAALSLLVIPLGLFIVYKQRKWILVFSFIMIYYLILILLNIRNIATISFFDTTLLFFAFFMLLEPMTSAYTKKAMAAQGIMVGILAHIFRLLPSADPLLLALLLSNIFVETMNKRLR